MDRSLFSKMSATTSRLLAGSSTPPHELPRWRSPSPMTASVIPPPIVQKSHAGTPSRMSQTVILEPTSPFKDRQSELEADLQFLLDAQANGLVKGLGGGTADDDEASNGSTTPTARSVKSSSTSTRQRGRLSRRKPGLRSARKGIYNAILALSSLKADELADIVDDVGDKDQKLNQIEEWEQKREGLQEATRSVDADEEAIRSQRLRQEADVLQEEINNVELQLADLKARHRKLMKRATAVENSVQAKLASYTSSLRLLDEDVQKFLSIEPSNPSARGSPQDGRASMWQLPAKRRTLEMAKQEWAEERRLTLQHRESVELEKTALDEGAAIWKETITAVTSFEQRLRSEVAQMSTSLAPQLVEGQPDDNNKLVLLLEDLGSLTRSLETSLQLARDRNWTLLIAAIGAELNALQQGRQLLDSVLRPSAESPEQMTDAASIDTDILGAEDGNAIHELDKSFHASTRRLSIRTNDSDPDPELMFSKHDTDTE